MAAAMITILLFSDRSITLHQDRLTSETSSSKANVDGGSRAALVGSRVRSESLRIETHVSRVTVVGAN
jgi:hypothetical protein